MTNTWKETAGSYAMIALGTFFMALGTNMVYEPMSMVTGGFAGIGIILRRFIPVPLWVVTMVLNLPLFVLAAKKFGMMFVQKTIYATICFSFFLAVVPEFPVTHADYLMAALLGGALNGTGLALVFGRRASTGGTCERTHNPGRETYPLSGGGAGAPVAEPQRATARPPANRNPGQLFAGQRHCGDGQDPQLPYIGQRAQMERGRYGPGGRASARPLTYRMGQNGVSRSMDYNTRAVKGWNLNGHLKSLPRQSTKAITN